MRENMDNNSTGFRELEEIRRELDGIDKEILDLFIKRQNLAKEVARYKAANNVPVLSPGREGEILERVRAAAGEEHGAAAVRLFEELLKSSREIQHGITDGPGRKHN